MATASDPNTLWPVPGRRRSDASRSTVTSTHGLASTPRRRSRSTTPVRRGFFQDNLSDESMFSKRCLTSDYDHSSGYSEPERENDPIPDLRRGEEEQSLHRDIKRGVLGTREFESDGAVEPFLSRNRRGKYGRRGRFHDLSATTAFEAAHAVATAGPVLPRTSLRKEKAEEVVGVIFSGVIWLGKLRREYGTKLLLLLFASQHVLKGVVQQFQASAVMWLLREYRVSGPRMQVYVSISNSAWALKPIIGIVSDLFPIFGYRKAPYVILTSFIGVICTTVIGLSSKTSTTVGSVVFALFGMQLQASTNDLLTEATYSEHIQEKPSLGPDLISFVWGGITIGNMIAISTVSFLISNYGPRAVFLACVTPSAAILYPTLMNYFEEYAYTRQQLEQVRAAFLKQREVAFLCVLMTFLTILLTIVGTVSTSHENQFYCGIGVLSVLLPAFNILLRPEIARVNTFFMLQAALAVNINGATFYFYTDTAEQYPEGPHFTPWFFTTALGLVASVMSLVGLATYTLYMKEWTYRSLLLFSNLLVTFLALLDVAMFRRENLKWGISDRLFVFGSSVSTIVVRQWQWMPGVVVMSQLCPVGMEATMFALLAGCMNLGNQIADFMGAYLLSQLSVHPTGALYESEQFTNLWKASCCATLLPAITIILIPCLMPKERQTEKLLMHDSTSATVGSPWSRMFAGSTQNTEVERVDLVEQHQQVPARAFHWDAVPRTGSRCSHRRGTGGGLGMDRSGYGQPQMGSRHGWTVRSARRLHEEGARDEEIGRTSNSVTPPYHSGMSSGWSSPAGNEGGVGGAPIRRSRERTY